jgi:aminomethyltransferase
VPVREDTSLADARGHKLGHVTSGTLAPTVDKPIAMAYLATNHTAASHEIYAEVRGKAYPMRICPMPFTPHRYHRGA